MNLSYTPRRFVPLPPAVLPPPGQPTTDPIMSGEHRARAASWWRSLRELDDLVKKTGLQERSRFFFFFKDICIQLMTLRYYLLLVHWNYANALYWNIQSYKGYKWDTLHGYTSLYPHVSIYLYLHTNLYIFLFIYIYRCIHIWCPFKHVRSSKRSLRDHEKCRIEPNHAER